MALVAVDKQLLQRCLSREPGAWNDFVDRYLGLFYHVIHYTAHLRSVVLRPEDVEDLASEILLQIVSGDYAVLRRFKGKSSLATYLTVIARRTCVHELVRRTGAAQLKPQGDGRKTPEPEAARASPAWPRRTRTGATARTPLAEAGAEVVRLFYLEGRTYEEISTQLRIPVNTIGPMLSRARKAMRKHAQGAAGDGSKKHIAATPKETEKRSCGMTPPGHITYPDSPPQDFPRTLRLVRAP